MKIERIKQPLGEPKNPMKNSGESLYDKVVLVMMNNFAFQNGMIDEKTKIALEAKIWAGATAE